MKDIPKKIYLQVSDENNTYCESFKELFGVTWHSERINESDVEYILNVKAESKNESQKET